MKTTIKKYGWRAALAMLIFGCLSMALATGTNRNYEISEVVGYLSMFLSMVFVFLGIKYFRDHVNDGAVSFGQSMKIGLLIALFPALTFEIMDQIYVNFINPNFYQEYYQRQVDKIQSDSPEEYQAQVEKLEQEREMFANPMVQFLVMFLTVFVIGVVVTIISGLILKRDPEPVS